MAALAQVQGRMRRMPVATFTLAAGVTALVLLPPVYLVVRAASEGAGIWDALTETSTVDALVRTVLLTATVTGTCIAIAVPLGWLTARTDLPMARAWTVLLALPLAIPSFVGAYVIISALGSGGLVQDMLEPLGVERLPSIYGFKGAWFVLSLLSYPYVYLQVCAALNRADPALEEAGRSLGKGAWPTFFHVSLPQLRPAIAAGGILIALDVLSEFGAVSMLHYDTLTPLMYIEYTTRFDRSAAAILGLPLIALAALFVLVDSSTRGSARYHARGTRRGARRLALGHWRWPALVFCSLIAALGVGLPVAVVLYWIVQGMREGAETGFVLEAIFTALLVLAVIASAVDPRGTFKSIAGLAIGLTITIDILFGGPLTGAAMNPSRAFGPQLVGNHWSDWWVWYLGPLAGGAVAAVVYELLFLRPPRPAPVDAPESELDEPRPGDATVA
jgi:iron(III) transport system permease protein